MSRGPAGFPAGTSARPVEDGSDRCTTRTMPRVREQSPRISAVSSTASLSPLRKTVCEPAFTKPKLNPYQNGNSENPKKNHSEKSDPDVNQRNRGGTVFPEIIHCPEENQNACRGKQPLRLQEPAGVFHVGLLCPIQNSNFQGEIVPPSVATMYAITETNIPIINQNTARALMSLSKNSVFINPLRLVCVYSVLDWGRVSKKYSIRKPSPLYAISYTLALSHHPTIY